MYSMNYTQPVEDVNPNFLGKLSTGVTNYQDRKDLLFGEGWSLPSGHVSDEGTITFDERASHARELCRRSYITPNPIFESAVNIKHSYTVGDKARVGKTNDELADDTIKKFVIQNNFNEVLANEIALEMFIDGEIFAVIDKDFDSTDPLQEGQVPFVGLLNAEHVTVFGDRIRKITAIQTTDSKGRPETFQKGEFSSWAHKANFGNLRGYPPFEGARQIAGSMVDFINGRLRINAIESRLNMVRKHLIWPKTERNKLTIDQQKAACTASVVSIPEDGGIIHAYIDAETGRSEETEFLKTNKAATDASKDYEILRRNFAAAMGLADHHLGWGDSTNRATAETIAEAVIKNFQYFQKAISLFVQDIIRKILVRVHGSEQLYTMRIPVEGNPEKFTEVQVTANELVIPVELPDLQTDSVTEKILFYEFAKGVGYSNEKILQALGLNNA